MAKLTSKKEYRKDGTKNVKAYAISLSKSGVELSTLADKEVEVLYERNKIIIKKI